MKTTTFLMIAVMAVAFSVNAKSAAAAVVDFSGSVVEMTPEPLDIGQTGTITGGGGGGSSVLSIINGILPPSSMVSFSYSFASPITSGLLADFGAYFYNDGFHDYAGWAADDSSSGTPLSDGTTDGTFSGALAFASAQLTGLTSGTAIIKNFSAGSLDFMAVFLGTVAGSTAFDVSYVVSAVPVPAALPMFGLGLAALAGYRARKRAKKQKKAIA
ncbi:MAG: hypothetical protein KDJ42_01130 [Alphaproteobacteria bacterium]|nr:hypothetical protein [Alphaproteobacteria bacterium]